MTVRIRFVEDFETKIYLKPLVFACRLNFKSSFPKTSDGSYKVYGRFQTDALPKTVIICMSPKCQIINPKTSDGSYRVSERFQTDDSAKTISIRMSPKSQVIISENE